uniref:Type III modification methylase n=1 Tax=Endomicrobium trichonymphae TaxID=1408204 RepID=A0A1C9ZYN4_ENDTX|nr:type III modification methylase [Candidatus Endomicrobium trichonymphae]
MKIILEKILEQIDYDQLNNWQLPSISYFSENKDLDGFPYQKEALKNITKALYLSFKTFQNGNTSPDKQTLHTKYKEYGLEDKVFSVCKFANNKDKNIGNTSGRFKFFQNYSKDYKVLGEGSEEYVTDAAFLNRACFWMSTGSGKSIVLIKTIELLDHLQKQNLIPKKEIMLLLPREDLIKQFKIEIEGFNKNRERKIELINLINYEDDKKGFNYDHSIKVYYYRSDLLRDERKESILDYRNYDNTGNWYIFLDEAHRGEKENSSMQSYVSVLSRNGFLFNFSATFTENIDYSTTCFNFNLEKFISEGYGKNLYLSHAYFNFASEINELSEIEKQKQVLKSLLAFTLIKKSKKQGCYHNPLLTTLVNSINTDNSDLLLFFKKIEEIAAGNITSQIFDNAKDEFGQELLKNKKYVLGQEELSFDIELFDKIILQDLLENIFNTKKHGKIELLEGETGKEIVLKLETTDKPFALIKIGDAKKFQREKLGDNYQYLTSPEKKTVFQEINENDDINLLLGSRSFYEGWDSNRPNVINMINIGGKEAKKFVLQSIGRGVRIEPVKGERKRLPAGNKNKNILLETLFIFATDKNSIANIVETIKEQKTKGEELKGIVKHTPPFELYIPKYEEETPRNNFAKFNLSKKALENIRKYIKNFNKNLLLLKHDISLENLNLLLEKIDDDNSFQIKEDNVYNDMDFLFNKLISHTAIKNKIFSGLKELEDEIIHFKHIKIFNLGTEDVELLNSEIENVKTGKKNEAKFRELKIKNIAKHYYLPLIYSRTEKIDYINHIIVNESEVKFIQDLEKYINRENISSEWMFSKIDETLDEEIGIPYFYRKDNRYRKFFPDFIFWIKKGNDYKIIFIDPKGTSRTDYENKVDDFEKLFPNLNIPYKGLNIKFDLRFYNDDTNPIGEKYKKYWYTDEDFSFLE